MKRVIYILTILALSFSSCTKEESYLPASGRFEKLFNDVDKTLKASVNGWKMQYFPDDKSVGGFNFMFKFEDGGKVTMASDFDSKIGHSTYKYYGGEGAVLTFDTYSLLHILADPQNAPQGKGFRGDYELIILEFSKDSVICKGRKGDKPMIFTRATAADWDDMDDIRANEKAFVAADEGAPFFKNLKIGDNAIATFLYNNDTRFLEYFFYNEAGELKYGKSGVYFTITGFSLCETIDVNGSNIKEFVYNKTTDAFTFNETGKLTPEHQSGIVFKNAWKKLNARPVLAVDGVSADFMKLQNEIKALVPDFYSMQFYWNFTDANYNLFTFVLVNLNIAQTTPRGFHTMMELVYSPEEDIVIFYPKQNPQTGRLMIIPSDDGLDGELESLFFSASKASEKMNAVIDIIYEPQGFTVIPTYDGFYYLISRKNSSIWLKLKPLE